MSVVSPLSSVKGSPNQSPLSSPIDSNEIHGKLDAWSDGSSCGSLSTNSDSKVTPEVLAEAYTWIEEIIDRLIDLSRSIRKSGKVQSDGKGERFIPSDENGGGQRPEFLNYARLVIRREVSGASDWLQQRLIDSMLTRWSRLLYRRRHQQKLSGVVQHTEIISQDANQCKETEKEGFETKPADISATQTISDPVSVAKKPAISSTYPSVKPGREPLIPKMSAATGLSRKARSSIQGSKLDIPKLPRSRIKKNVFECPYCCILCPEEEAIGPFWKLVSRTAESHQSTNAKNQGTYYKRPRTLSMYI